jgi:hypothetical protein
MLNTFRLLPSDRQTPFATRLCKGSSGLYHWVCLLCIWFCGFIVRWFSQEGGSFLGADLLALLVEYALTVEDHSSEDHIGEVVGFDCQSELEIRVVREYV